MSNEKRIFRWGWISSNNCSRINLCSKVYGKVDFILTHCTASSTAALLSHGLYKPDKLTNYFEEIRCNIDYKRWLCGHYHDNKAITIKDIVLYEQIVRIA